MLTDEQMRQFRKDGYLVFEALIQGERLAYYKQVFDELGRRGAQADRAGAALDARVGRVR